MFLICGVFVGICLFLLQNTIAIVLVASILDYCNSLVYNITFKDVTKLQRVRNCLVVDVIGYFIRSTVIIGYDRSSWRHLMLRPLVFSLMNLG